MRRIDLSDAPAEALRDTVTDRILGAWAERTLHERGLPVPAAEVPASARAALLADELADANRAAMLTYRMTDEYPDQDPGLLPELGAAAGQAVAVWPGGATDPAVRAGAFPGHQVTSSTRSWMADPPPALTSAVMDADRPPGTHTQLPFAGLVYTMV